MASTGKSGTCCMERVTPLFIRDVALGRPITIFGKEKVLDFTWVDDCVDAIVSRGDAVLCKASRAVGLEAVADGVGQP